MSLYRSVSGGELFEKVVENNELMSEDEAREYVRQILLGVQHMHKHNIVHLDLKVSLCSNIKQQSVSLQPENILLKSSDSNEIKIIDFGLARQLDPNHKAR